MKAPIERMREARGALLEVTMGLEVVVSTLKASREGLSAGQVTVLLLALDDACNGLSEVGAMLR